MTTSFQLLAMWLRVHTGRDERGASLIEYALLIALIAVVCILAISFFGSSMSSKYQSVGTLVDQAGT